MVVIDTPLGPMRGKTSDGYVVFRGIRYAKAPTGDQRFRPPVPVEPWSEEYDATHYGPSAPQLPPQVDGDVQIPADPTSEDCLFLNVYTPVADDGARPVLFWIHGGGYVNGSGRLYNGRLFARDHDAVVVTINYRMGAIGFMHVGHLQSDLHESVNNGILDQICALEWTRDNIAAFGGDPNNVLVFGESAGGTSTALLLGCPRAEGLFHKAVVHSPHADVIPVGDGHVSFTSRCIERLGGDPAKNGMETLRAASVEELVALNAPDPTASPAAGLGLRRANSVSFSPAIDGSLIPRPIADTIRARGKDNVPFLGGGCRHEGTLFEDIVGRKDYTEQEAIDLFEQEGFDGKWAMAAYEEFAPASTPRQKLVYALTDTMFRNSMVRILDAATESGGRCWSWMCCFENDQPDDQLRATHAMELPFLWDWIGFPGFITAAGENPPSELGAAMRQYWANFAHTGQPFAADEPEWPSYSIPSRPVLILDTERRMEDGLDDEVRQFWFE